MHDWLIFRFWLEGSQRQMCAVFPESNLAPWQHRTSCKAQKTSPVDSILQHENGRLLVTGKVRKILFCQTDTHQKKLTKISDVYFFVKRAKFCSKLEITLVFAVSYHILSYTVSFAWRGGLIGHFRITLGLFFKASPGAHPFICKSIFIHTQINIDLLMKG